MRKRYVDRDEAGRVLAQHLSQYAGRDDVLVLGLPRGGVPVAAQVAESLGAPLDVIVVRKLGLPEQPELAMGAIAAVGDTVELVRNEVVLHQAEVTNAEFDDVFNIELTELRRRMARYRAGRAAPPLAGRVVIVVDDGLATGSTMRAAITALRAQRPSRLVVAVPTGARDTCKMLNGEADEVLCVRTPEPFGSVGQSYDNFPQTSDREVTRYLGEA